MDHPPSHTFRVSTFAPANETAADIWAEICNLDGTVLCAVAYGAHATLFFTCFSALLPQRQKKPKQTYAFLAYITLMFLLGSAGFVSNARINELTFIENRDFPGGPNIFFLSVQGTPWAVLGHVAYMFATWLQDLLLIWRFFIFWERKLWMLVIPFSCFIVSFVVGTMLLISGSSIWQGSSFNIFTTFWAAELTTTIVVTALIVGRLFYVRRHVRKVMGPNHDTPYLSVAAMIIESGLLISVSGLVFVICYGLNSPFQNIILSTIGQLEGIAPLLIIIRVAQGRGLSTTTPLRSIGTRSSNIGFASANSRQVIPTVVILQPSPKMEAEVEVGGVPAQQ